MAIVQIDQGLMTINQLWRMVLRQVFDKKKSGQSDVYLINNSIQKWSEIVRQHNVKLADAFGDAAFQQAVGRRGSIIDEVEYQLMEMSKWLVEDEKGNLESKKDTYRRHGIDYRKTFPNIFPECRPGKRELARAKALKEKNDQDNRELLN